MVVTVSASKNKTQITKQRTHSKKQGKWHQLNSPYCSKHVNTNQVVLISFYIVLYDLQSFLYFPKSSPDSEQ